MRELEGENVEGFLARSFDAQFKRRLQGLGIEHEPQYRPPMLLPAMYIRPPVGTKVRIFIPPASLLQRLSQVCCSGPLMICTRTCLPPLIIKCPKWRPRWSPPPSQ